MFIGIPILIYTLITKMHYEKYINHGNEKIVACNLPVFPIQNLQAVKHLLKFKSHSLIPVVGTYSSVSLTSPESFHIFNPSYRNHKGAKNNAAMRARTNNKRR